MDREKSGQFKGCYCILNATGVKETDEPGGCSGGGGNGDPPSWLAAKPQWENEGGRGKRRREEGE